MKTVSLVKVSTLTNDQKFIDPASGLAYRAQAIAGPDHIIAVADKGKDMFFHLEYEVIPAN